MRTLEGLPLALDQAGAYIEEMGESLEGYIQLFISAFLKCASGFWAGNILIRQLP